MLRASRLRQSPYTAVPGRLAALVPPRGADLHIHTTASDGEFTAAQVGALARQANLAAVAVTDHDIIADPDEIRAAAEEVEVIPGVEISARFNDREVHLLGYFIGADNGDLNNSLARLREARRNRFHEFVARLAASGTTVPLDRIRTVEVSSPSLGRRHLARLLVQTGFASSRAEAFRSFLGPISRSVAQKSLLPIEEAIHLVRAAGGVASLAHPSPDLTATDFQTLAAMGLAALEVEYPWGRSSRTALLRAAAAALGLGITGGSDCHGSDPSHRRIGSHGISREELNALRGWRGRGVASICRD
jgi:3',5'-nucleoside bisphosphate phosphatase